MNDPVIDLIIRIKNASMVRNETVEIDHSSYKEEVLKKLKSMKYIDGYEVVGDVKKTILITLRYKDGVPALTDLKIHSKPGERVYTSYTKIKSVLGGMGSLVVSTPKGILTGKEAKNAKVGGELLFEIR